MKRSFITNSPVIALASCLIITSLHAESSATVLNKMYVFFDRAESRPDLDRQLVSSLRSRVRMIQDISARFDIAKSDPEYIKVLAHDADILQRALADPGRESSNAAIKMVQEDLDLKIRYQTASAGAKDTFRGRVQVRVFTKKAGAEVAGLVVGASPRMWAERAEPMFPLGASSPAIGSLPPGIYRVTVNKAGGPVVVTQDCSVGLSGADAEDVTVVLPDGS